MGTLERQPKDATHWSRASMAEATGCRSPRGRIWKLGLKPHLVKTFKVSNDPHFAEKVVDVVGLYLDPPEHALVLCVDEKSQIQALDRLRKPFFPCSQACSSGVTHDYKRNGITTLFAALNVATGEITGSIHRRHRAVEFKKFLTKLDKDTPADLDVHVICDNYATHKAPAVANWLAGHPRFHMHHTPTYSSWLNQVERWFGLLTDKQCGAAHTAQSRPWRKTSATGSPLGTRTQNPSPDQTTNLTEGTQYLQYAPDSGLLRGPRPRPELIFNEKTDSPWAGLSERAR